MSTLTGYIITRENYMTFDKAPLTVVDAEPTGEITGLFRVWLEQAVDLFASFYGGRIGSPYGKWAPNRAERGFRAVVVEYDWPGDVASWLDPGHTFHDSNGVEHTTLGETDAPHEGRHQVLLSRADAVDELTVEELYALTPDRPRDLLASDVNYAHQRDSMGVLLG